MKPKEYARKYDLDNSKSFDRNLFIADLTLDFQNLLETHWNSGVWNYSKFRLCISQIKKKFDSINYRTDNSLSDKLWGYFYATIVCPLREELFGEELRRKREEWEERQRQENWFFHLFNYSFAQDFFRSVYENLKLKLTSPEESFLILGFSKEDEPSEGEIKRAYRNLALVHHPDRGGDPEEFMKVTEAKNKILRYIAT